MGLRHTKSPIKHDEEFLGPFITVIVGGGQTNDTTQCAFRRHGHGALSAVECVESNHSGSGVLLIQGERLRQLSADHEWLEQLLNTKGVSTLDEIGRLSIMRNLHCCRSTGAIGIVGWSSFAGRLFGIGTSLGEVILVPSLGRPVHARKRRHSSLVSGLTRFRDAKLTPFSRNCCNLNSVAD